jgi:hypothetical protein
VDKLLASRYISVEDTHPLINEASKYKCERTISLADCFCLAFARKEKDLVKEMQRKPFDVEILFLEDYG